MISCGLIYLLLTTNSFAQNNNLKDHIAEAYQARWEIKQIYRRQEIIMDILEKLCEKTYGRKWPKIREEILWQEREEFTK